MKRLIILLPFVLVACASKKNGGTEVSRPEVQVSPVLERKFNEGLMALEREDYARAAKAFDGILVDQPTSQFELISLFNSGSAYEGLKQCQTATDRFRRAALLSAKRYPRIEAGALFRLSFAYECLGQSAKSLASLIDAQVRAEYLVDDVRLAELPARIALTYARLGQDEKAMEYFEKAQAGILALSKQLSQRSDLKETLVKTLYLMGKSSQRSIDAVLSAEDVGRTIKMQQAILFRAIDLNVAPWSVRAKDEILNLYKGIWQHPHDSAVDDDPQIRDRSLATNETRLITQVLSAIEDLNAFKIPEGTPNRIKEQLFRELELIGKSARLRFESLKELTPLSLEAERREGINPPGKIKSEITDLERKSRSPPSQKPKK